MQHIDDFIIHRFRGLRDLKIEKLGQINLFVGNNNSGKTSVLEALSIYCDPLNWRKWYEVGFVREVPNSPLQSILIDQLIWLFPQKGNAKDKDKELFESSEILLTASGSFPIGKVTAAQERVSRMARTPSWNIKLGEEGLQIDDDVMQYREEEIEGLKIHVSAFENGKQISTTQAENVVAETLAFYENRDTPPVRLSKRPIQEIPTLPTQFVNPFSHRSSALLPSLWSEVVEADLKTETVDLLRFFDPGIQEVDIILPTARRQDISVKHAKLGRAPLSTFGDGLRRVFTLATTIPRVKGGLLLVDELETAIHTRALEKTFDWLIKACIHNNVQLFATTHSLEALDAVIEVARDSADLVVYRLQQDKEQTNANRFDKDMIIRLREELGQEVRLHHYLISLRNC